MILTTLRAPAVPVPVDERPAPLPPDSLAARAAVGLTGGSGEVAPWRALTNGYQNGNVISEFIGQRPVIQGNPSLVDLPPDSLYADRPMYGGVRTAPAFGEFHDEQFTGGHVLMTNRPPLVLVESDQMSPQEWVAPTEWRDVPAVTDLCRRVAPIGAHGLTGTSGVS